MWVCTAECISVGGMDSVMGVHTDIYRSSFFSFFVVTKMMSMLSMTTR